MGGLGSTVGWGVSNEYTCETMARRGLRGTYGKRYQSECMFGHIRPRENQSRSNQGNTEEELRRFGGEVVWHEGIRDVEDFEEWFS